MEVRDLRYLDLRHLELRQVDLRGRRMDGRARTGRAAQDGQDDDDQHRGDGSPATLAATARGGRRTLSAALANLVDPVPELLVVRVRTQGHGCSPLWAPTSPIHRSP